MASAVDELNRKNLTQAIIRHLDEWQLTEEEIANLLALDASVHKRHIKLYRQGAKVLPTNDAMTQRIEHIIGIADALRTTFPFSSQMRLLWLRKAHRRFQQRTPLNLMLTEGLEGLLKVRIEVDCAYGYAISDAMHAAYLAKPTTS